MSSVRPEKIMRLKIVTRGTRNIIIISFPTEKFSRGPMEYFSSMEIIISATVRLVCIEKCHISVLIPINCILVANLPFLTA